MAVIDRLNELPKVRHAADYCQALVYAGLGKHEVAIKQLERAFAHRYDRLIYLRVEPIFDMLRPEPAFQKLIHRMGL